MGKVIPLRKPREPRIDRLDIAANWDDMIPTSNITQLLGAFVAADDAINALERLSDRAEAIKWMRDKVKRMQEAS